MAAFEGDASMMDLTNLDTDMDSSAYNNAMNMNSFSPDIQMEMGSMPVGGYDGMDTLNTQEDAGNGMSSEPTIDPNGVGAGPLASRFWSSHSPSR